MEALLHALLVAASGRTPWPASMQQGEPALLPGVAGTASTAAQAPLAAALLMSSSAIGRAQAGADAGAPQLMQQQRTISRRVHSWVQACHERHGSQWQHRLAGSDCSPACLGRKLLG